jgi:hypothetical protein
MEKNQSLLKSELKFKASLMILNKDNHDRVTSLFLIDV